MNAGSLHRLARELRAVATVATRDADEPTPSAGHLAIVEDVAEHGPTPIGAVARRTGFAQSLVSRSVAAMRDAGVLTCDVDPGDRRRARVAIDPEARKGVLRERAQRPVRPALALRHPELPPDRLDRVEALARELDALLTAPAGQPFPVRSPGRPVPAASGYVDVGGIRVWHQVSGNGAPLVLLHGAFAGADSWAAQVPDLVAAGYHVFAPERSGHAHTPDRPGPLTYASMADETIAYLDEIVGARAHLIGWSDGAVVALLVAQRRPELVDRLVLIGQYYNSAGRRAGGIVDQLVAAGPEAMAFLRLGYDPVTPDGADHFEVVFRKTMKMLAEEPELRLATLKDVASPALILQGDRDDVTLAHGAAVADALPRGRLAVLPGTHLLPMETPAVVNGLITTFLRAEPSAPKA
jgi:pimeloyl-ACP methyl ester carboxylesterase/DNA-binding MarR family transcriptional regulator